MPCTTKCIKTASLGPEKGRIVLSQYGNRKYPRVHTPHEQCPDCVAAEYAEMLADIKKLKGKNVLGAELAAKWNRVEENAKNVMKK